VYSLAECEAKAENLGRKFLNFDAAKNLCFTSLTCNNQKRTLYKWQIFKLSDPAPVQSTVSQRNPAPSTTGWEQFAQPNLKCERPKGTPAKQRVANLAACESLAESRGAPYLNFEPGRSECFTSPSCSAPKKAHLPWTIYHRAARPRGLELVAILEPKMKCERPAGDAPAVVEDLAACRADAEAQGRKFVNFEKARKLCYTSITCDRPAKSRSYEWQVYKLDEATSSTQ